MSISEILMSEDKPKEKITKLAKAVKAIRADYGNTDVDIPMPDVRCATGMLPLSDLDAEGQLTHAETTVALLKAVAREANEETVGIELGKYTQQLVATNPILVNLGETRATGVL